MSQLTKQILEAWRPPPRLSLSEWADRYGVLTGDAAEKGRWVTLPYQRGIMDAFTDPTVETVVCMKSARVGWTMILGHVIGYYSHQDPCPVMVIQPIVEDAENYSKEQIAPMFNDTPVLQGLITESKSKNTATNTILLKQLTNGGTIDIVGANSGRAFRRKSRRVVLFDEASAYRTISEGDPIKLGRNRSDYFWNRKIGIGSTPILKGFDKTETWFLKSDQRRYFVPCPFCEHKQVLRWGQMKWEKGKPETAEYECENCSKRIPHSKKRWMVERGQWRATAVAAEPGLVGFHIWAGYSFSPNAEWGKLAREFLDVKGDPEQLQTFVNTILGETWEEEYSNQISAEGLAARRENYPSGYVPDGALLLTAGVDTQDDRLAVAVWAYGRGEEAWHVWSQEIWGDPSKPEVWQQLDAVLETAWPTVSGGHELKIAQMAIDSGGHFTHEVYEYCRLRQREGVIPIKGSSIRGKQPIGKGTPVDINKKNAQIKRGVLLYTVGHDTIKATLYGRLRHEKPGPGYIHFGSASTDEFLRQLTPWKVQIKYVKGQAVRDWVKPASARDEMGDCTVYAYAALQLLGRRYHAGTMWDKLSEQLTTTLPKPEVQAKPAKGQSSWLPKTTGNWLGR
jgi:phage terminase large subunit GpA-like protein